MTRFLYVLIAVLLVTVFVLQGAAALRQMAPTGDETHYLAVGCYLLKTHQWNIDDALLHPPLSYYLHSVLLWFQKVDYRAFEIPDINERGRVILASTPGDGMLILARIPVLVLATLLGCLILVWGWQAYGPACGLGALFLYTFSPAILSNAALITPDLCLAFCSTLTLYLFWRYWRRPGYVTLLGAGAALGLALLSKFTGIFVVFSIVVVSAVGTWRERHTSSPLVLRRRLIGLVLALLVAVLVVDAGYLFVDILGWQGEASFKSKLFQRIGESGLLRCVPLPRAFVMGIDLQYTVLENGFGYFMLGQISKQGWYSYYLIAFLLKSPVPFLLVLLLALVFKSKKGVDSWHWIVLVPVVLFFLYFSVERVSRGLRYVLPAYPLLFLWVSQALGSGVERFRRVLAPVLAGLALWYAAGTLWIAPHYLAYFNELCGGPDQGYRLFWEADFDWGQELKALGRYLNDNKIGRVRFGYFGTADPRQYGINYEVLPCDAVRMERGDPPVVVSATALNWDCYKWLRDYQPDKKIGYTIFIYNLPARQ